MRDLEDVVEAMLTSKDVQHDFESASAYRTSLAENGRPGRIRSPFFTIHIWIER